MKDDRYKLSCECGGRIRIIAQPEEARRALSEFNRRHSVCSPGAPRWRCGVCGCLLLHKDVCPVHRESLRVAWTRELDGAYWAVVQAMAAGLTPSSTLAHAAVYARAVDLARRWDGHRVVSLRREVVA